METYGRIYRLTDKTNGKMYHGQTTEEDINVRWKTYKKLNCKGQPKLYNALKAHGPENFLFEVIDASAKDLPQLNTLETFYIRKFDSMNNGYNCNEGGDGRGHICEETRQKIIKSLKLVKRSDDFKKRVSEVHKGRKRSEETKKRLSDSLKGNTNCLGRIVSEETRVKLSKPRREGTGQKISDALKGHKFSKETKLKMSLARMGKVPWNKGISRIDNPLSGKTRSDETKRKISEKAKLRHERWRAERMRAPLSVTLSS